MHCNSIISETYSYGIGSFYYPERTLENWLQDWYLHWLQHCMQGCFWQSQSIIPLQCRPFIQWIISISLHFWITIDGFVQVLICLSFFGHCSFRPYLMFELFLKVVFLLLFPRLPFHAPAPTQNTRLFLKLCIF